MAEDFCTFKVELDYVGEHMMQRYKCWGTDLPFLYYDKGLNVRERVGTALKLFLSLCVTTFFLLNRLLRPILSYFCLDFYYSPVVLLYFYRIVICNTYLTFSYFFAFRFVLLSYCAFVFTFRSWKFAKICDYIRKSHLLVRPQQPWISNFKIKWEIGMKSLYSEKTAEC